MPELGEVSECKWCGEPIRYMLRRGGARWVHLIGLEASGVWCDWVPVATPAGEV